MGWILRNHIKTRREFRIFYKKGTGILSEITLGNIKKKGLKLKKLNKGNKWGLGVLIDFTLDSFFSLVLSSRKPYFIRQYSLNRTFL